MRPITLLRALVLASLLISFAQSCQVKSPWRGVWQVLADGRWALVKALKELCKPVYPSKAACYRDVRSSRSELEGDAGQTDIVSFAPPNIDMTAPVSG